MEFCSSSVLLLGTLYWLQGECILGTEVGDRKLHFLNGTRGNLEVVGGICGMNESV